MGAQLIDTDGAVDITMDLTDAFHNFANAPTNGNLSQKCRYVKIIFMKTFFTENLGPNNFKVCYQ
jgi:hypothetical protein